MSWCRGRQNRSNKQQQQAISDFLTLYDNNIVPFSSSDYGK